MLIWYISLSQNNVIILSPFHCKEGLYNFSLAHMNCWQHIHLDFGAITCFCFVLLFETVSPYVAQVGPELMISCLGFPNCWNDSYAPTMPSLGS
jgi:hypothetical protein